MGVQVMKTLTAQFYPGSLLLLSFLPQHFVSKRPYSLNVYNQAHKIIALGALVIVFLDSKREEKRLTRR
jgi:hypothetical protein